MRGAELRTPQTTNAAEELEDRIRALKPQTDAERRLQDRSLELTADLLQTRWLVIGAAGPSVPLVFMIILTLWLAILFAGFGLLAPPNPIVGGALLLGALSVASAVFLILELDRPFDGLLRLSDAPLRFALSRLGQ